MSDEKEITKDDLGKLYAELDRILGKITSIDERLTKIEAKDVKKAKTVIEAKIY